MHNKQYFVYILTNTYNTVFYIGVTNNLLRRVYQHKNKLLEGFTKRYNVHKLVYYEIFELIEYAIKREKTLKNLVRRKKIELIKTMNLEFKELEIY